VQSALIALIAFMQTPGNGAIGSLDTSVDVRKEMAADARNSPPKQSTAERQTVVDSLHQRMIESEEQSRVSYKRMTESQCDDKKEEDSQGDEESAEGSNKESFGHEQKGIPSASNEVEKVKGKDERPQVKVDNDPKFEGQNVDREHGDIVAPENGIPMSTDADNNNQPIQLPREQSKSTHVLEDILLTGAAIFLIILIALIILKKTVSFISLSQQEEMLSGANLVQSEL
jgi:hypothetical protein